jgi:hypothetical protein
MPIRKSTPEERASARDSRLQNPHALATATTAVVGIRDSLVRGAHAATRALQRARDCHDVIGAAGVEAELGGAAAYAEVRDDFNALRDAILAVDPTADVPAAL